MTVGAFGVVSVVVAAGVGTAAGALVTGAGYAASAGTVTTTVTGGFLTGVGAYAWPAVGLIQTAGTALLTHPIGWLALGAAEDKRLSGNFTFDCWKPVLHDESSEPSNGKLLKDIFTDP